MMRQQLLHLGFIPFFMGDEADKVTQYFQTGSRGMARRAHQVVEMRNFLCGNIKRDDPVSRRFIQYLSMETWEIRALVRDRKTGRVRMYIFIAGLVLCHQPATAVVCIDCGLDLS